MRPRMLCLVDDSPDTLACAFVAHRIAAGLGIALTFTAPPSTAWARTRTRVAPLSALARAAGSAGDATIVAFALPWRRRDGALRRLAGTLRCPLVVVTPRAARRLGYGVAVEHRVVAYLVHGDSAVTHRVAGRVAHAMNDRLSAVDAATLCHEPVALGHQIELLVVESQAVRRRATWSALLSTGAPLLLVPRGGEDTWQRGWLGASAPLALVRRTPVAGGHGLADREAAQRR